MYFQQGKWADIGCFREIKQACFFIKCWQRVNNKFFVVFTFMFPKGNFALLLEIFAKLHSGALLSRNVYPV